MPFRDRDEAARLLAERLSHLRGEDPFVVAVPRGAVPMGRVLAEELDGDLDVVLVHKLGAPGNPELAVGAVTETGELQPSDVAAALGVGDDYLEAEAAAQLARLREQRRRYTAGRPARDPAGRVVVVVDDGVATGATLSAAVKALRSRRPRRLVAAVAVAPPATAARLRGEVDELVCLETPDPFEAVSRFFLSFPQVSDEEVVRVLAEHDAARRRRVTPPRPGDPEGPRSR